MRTAVPGYKHVIIVNQGQSQWKPHTPITKLSFDNSHYATLRISIEEDAANAMPLLLASFPALDPDQPELIRSMKQA
jgi:hypothetical protein